MPEYIRKSVAQMVILALANPDLWRECIANWLDDFYTAPSDEERLRMISEEPPILEDPIQRAWIAAMVEHLAFLYKIRCPAWCARPEHGPLRKDCWYSVKTKNMRAFAFYESPIAFRRRNLFTMGNVLDRASMPERLRFHSMTRDEAAEYKRRQEARRQQER